MKRPVLILLLITLVSFSPSFAAGGNGPGSDIRREVKKLFLNYLAERSGSDPSDFNLTRFRVSKNLKIPRNGISIKAIPALKDRFAGYVKLQMGIWHRGEYLGRIFASAWVERSVDVLSAARDLRKGEPISEKDLVFKRINVNSPDLSFYLTDVDDLSGMVCRRGIRAGSVIKRWMLKIPAIVEKGDLVLIVAESSGLRVTVPGMAMASGRINDVIWVENSMSRKKVMARIVDEKTVVVSF